MGEGQKTPHVACGNVRRYRDHDSKNWRADFRPHFVPGTEQPSELEA